MNILCNFAQGDAKTGRIYCMAGDPQNPQLCSFQRYCTQKSEWQNTSNYDKCRKRGQKMARKITFPLNEDKAEMLEESKVGLNKEVAKNEEAVVEAPKDQKLATEKKNDEPVIEPKVINVVRKKAVEGKVLAVTDSGVIAHIPSMHQELFLDGFTDKKVGDWIEFEPN